MIAHGRLSSNEIFSFSRKQSCSTRNVHGLVDGPIYAVKYVIRIHVTLIKRFFKEGEPATRVLAPCDPRVEVDLAVGFTV